MSDPIRLIGTPDDHFVLLVVKYQAGLPCEVHGFAARRNDNVGTLLFTTFPDPEIDHGLCLALERGGDRGLLPRTLTSERGPISDVTIDIACSDVWKTSRRGIPISESVGQGIMFVRRVRDRYLGMEFEYQPEAESVLID